MEVAVGWATVTVSEVSVSGGVSGGKGGGGQGVMDAGLQWQRRGGGGGGADGGGSGLGGQ